MNSIALATKYQPLLDEIFKLSALTADLESDKVKFDGVHTVKIMKIKVPALGKYTRNSGFTSGDVEVTWQDWELTQDRGRSFDIDSVDNEETMDMTFGAACNEFIRTKVAPQIDTYRFSTLASKEGISSASGALESGADVIAALRTATQTMDNDEVPKEGRILYITYEAKGFVDDLDLTKSKAVMSRFAKVIEVPTTRFYTNSQYNTTTEEIERSSTSKDINFLIVAPSAVQATAKHQKLRIFLADGDEGTGANKNQKKDAHEFQYRIVHDINVYENKVAGIYCHHAA